MSIIESIRGKEALEPTGVERAHAQEKNALIQTLAATRMRLQQCAEEGLFLRNIRVVSSRFQAPEDAKMIKVLQRAETSLVKLALVEGLIRVFGGLIPKNQLQESRQEFDAILKSFDEIEPILDKVAVEFNKFTAEDRKELQEVFAKNGFSRSPAFLKRCERVAKQAIAA